MKNEQCQAEDKLQVDINVPVLYMSGRDIESSFCILSLSSVMS